MSSPQEAVGSNVQPGPFCDVCSSQGRPLRGDYLQLRLYHDIAAYFRQKSCNEISDIIVTE